MELRNDDFEVEKQLLGKNVQINEIISYLINQLSVIQRLYRVSCSEPFGRPPR
jgi:hypothetical protein